MLHRFPQQVFVDCAENLIGQLQRADFFAAQIYYVNRCHNLFQLPVPVVAVTALSSAITDNWQLTLTNYFFLPDARFEAFNGSTVPAPLNPRRSLGGFFALVITT